MRIHTSTLRIRDLQAAMLNATEKAPQVSLHILSTHGSRSHKQAFDVALRGHGTRHTKHPQTAILGGERERAATQDDWGYFLAEVFAMAPLAHCGPYKSSADFFQQTKGKYTP